MRLGIPQLIILTLYILNIGVSLARHGEKKKEDKYNFFGTLIFVVIEMAILNWGGFFR